MSIVKNTQSFNVTAEDAGKRLDHYLTAHLEDVSRTRVQQLIEQQRVEVDGTCERASFKLRGSELIIVNGPVQLAPLRATAENIPLDVVYEDESLAVINKPSGMMVHAGAGHASEFDDEDDPRTHGTLVNALLYRFRKLSAEGGDLRPGIVHRLDKDTSGLIIVAKNDSAHRKLAEQFSSRLVKKSYVALVHGWPKADKGTIKLPVGRDRTRRARMSVKSPTGRDAVTHYNVRERLNTPYGKFSLLDVTIDTGRTHQIRVHMASMGNPVVGDTLYGAPTQITPLSSSLLRARPADTKATRDRASSDLARVLTEQAFGDAGFARKNRRKKTASKLQTAPDPIVPVSLNRNFLHAAALEFTHPKSRQKLSLSRDLPPELDTFLARLRHLN